MVRRMHHHKSINLTLKKENFNFHNSRLSVAPVPQSLTSVCPQVSRLLLLEAVIKTRFFDVRGRQARVFKTGKGNPVSQSVCLVAFLALDNRHAATLARGVTVTPFVNSECSAFCKILNTLTINTFNPLSKMKVLTLDLCKGLSKFVPSGASSNQPPYIALAW